VRGRVEGASEEPGPLVKARNCFRFSGLRLLAYVLGSYPLKCVLTPSRDRCTIPLSVGTAGRPWPGWDTVRTWRVGS
jgi:hypothetical protein